MDLESHQFIAYFEPEQVTQLCNLAIVENFQEQKVIFEEGQIPDFIYLVLDGQVAFSKQTGPNKYQTIAVAQSNDFFGEFGVLDGQPRSARAVACNGATLAKIPREGLMEILHNTKGSVVLKLFLHIIQQLRITTSQYVKQMVHKEKMELVGEMVNTIVHDFKSPFNGIQLSSAVLKELHPDRETQEWCDLIQAQITRMLAMAEELLEFARGSSVLHKQPVNLSRMLQKFEKLNHIYFQYAKIEFITQAADVTVEVDENKLMRVLQNLVTNAIEAFEGENGRIEVTVQPLDEWVEIQISDNGPGIPEEIQKNFFEAFVTQGKKGGTGLGTAIAKSIINAHNGQISFESKRPGGTTFYIHLPGNL